MLNIDTLQQKIQEEIIKIHNLAEHTRKGSDHHYHRSLNKIEFKKPKKVNMIRK
ncbi:MAG: hypothetical protein ACFFEY_16095 [Candidatus Thorarchaeota archaeon]